MSTTTDPCLARRWLRNRPALAFQRSAHILRRNLDRSEATDGPHLMWVCEEDDDPAGAVAYEAHSFADGSCFLWPLDGARWTISEIVGGAGMEGRTRQGRLVLSTLEIDQYAEEVAPEGWWLQRGEHGDLSDNAATRWYVCRTGDEPDRTGPGFATIRDALAEIERRAG